MAERPFEGWAGRTWTSSPLSFFSYTNRFTLFSSPSQLPPTSVRRCFFFFFPRPPSGAFPASPSSTLGELIRYSNIFVTAPGPENLKTLFEFVIKDLDALDYKVRFWLQKSRLEFDSIGFRLGFNSYKKIQLSVTCLQETFELILLLQERLPPTTVSTIYTSTYKYCSFSPTILHVSDMIFLAPSGIDLKYSPIRSCSNHGCVTYRSDINSLQVLKYPF